MNQKLFFDKLLFVQNTEQNNFENFQPIAANNQNLTPNIQPVSPDNPPWNWLAAIGIWLVSLALITVPSFIALFYAMSKGVNFKDTEATQKFLYTDYGSILILIGLIIPIHLITFAISWALVTNLKKYPFRQTLGWEWGGFKIWHLAVIVIAFFLLALALTSYFGAQENELTKLLQSSRIAVYIIAFLATFTAPIVEEVVYRGIIYSAFQKSFGVLTGVIVTTVLFAAVHYVQYWGDVTALTMVTLLSLTLTMVRVKTGNLLPCIILHFVFNGIQSILLILEPFLKEQAEQMQKAATIFHLLK